MLLRILTILATIISLLVLMRRYKIICYDGLGWGSVFLFDFNSQNTITITWILCLIFDQLSQVPNFAGAVIKIMGSVKLSNWSIWWPTRRFLHASKDSNNCGIWSTLITFIDGFVIFASDASSIITKESKRSLWSSRSSWDRVFHGCFSSVGIRLYIVVCSDVS